MSRGWRDHYVPQLLIRRFTNDDGRVFCFDKKAKRIPDRIRGNQPRDILHRNKYYIDQFGDLDKELYKPIEDTFGPHLLALVDDLQAAMSRPGLTKAVTEWVAAQVSRTQFAEQLLKVYGRRFGRDDLLDDLRKQGGALNSLRVNLFEHELAALQGVSWRVYKADATERGRFVLSDEAVIKTPPAWATGTMVLVPLSPTTMVAGGSEKGHSALRDPDRGILPLGLNGLAMSYAYRFVYAQRLVELDSVASMFAISGDPPHDDWMRHAALPHFGLDLMLDEASESELRHHFRHTPGLEALLRGRPREK